MPIDPAFIHLRLHSEYSITDSIIRIDEVLARAAQDHMPALALTDLGNLFGLVKFYQSAEKIGIKPIIGCDAWISNEADRNNPFRVLLLCQTHSGYLLLCRLLSRAYRENLFRGRAELKKAWLHSSAEGTEDLIAISGAHFGEVGQLIIQNNLQEAQVVSKEWSELFPNRFYLEIQRNGRVDEERFIRNSLILAAQLNIPIVATHAIQFLDAKDYKAHEARVCIAEGYVLGDRRRPRAFTDQQYFKTQSEMQALFADIPEALANSVEIAKRCNLQLELGINRLPLFPVPDTTSIEAYLSNQALSGLKQRLQDLPENEFNHKLTTYQARLNFEVNTIIQMGFAGYFLIVADFINWAKQNNIPVGPGRGSGAGSLVAYSLGITDLDPLRYDLLFERFLNPERISMPDFDIDFCQDRRESVIEYVKNRYGMESVSQIVTFGTMAAKAVIRDVGRVLDLPFNFVDQLAKLIPFELGMTLKKARAIEPQFESRAREEEDVRNLLELAESLEGITRNVGMHAGGVLIAPGKITDFCPIYCAEASESVVSQFDKDDVEKIGLVKFDFLGLKTLTILDQAISDINQQQLHDIKYQTEPESTGGISLNQIALEDPETYALLRKGNAVGIFQFESRGMKDLLQKAKPDRFEDLIALVALYRPGPMDLIPDFIERKHGIQRVEYLDPRLEPILGPTYGVMIYQEQVMQIAQVIGGYSLGGADLLRRAMGKKKVEEMAQQRDIFVEGAIKNGLTEQNAIKLFDLMEKFAGYGFNKSHAAAYALIAFQTAYLKAHYPAAFLAACLSAEMNDTDKINDFYEDCKVNGINVLPPDINFSMYRFVPTDAKTIRYGLGAVKGTGENAITAIVQARERSGLFTDLFDFCKRVDRRLVNRRSIESLIRVGAFDGIQSNRAMLFASVGSAMEFAEQSSLSTQQVNLFSETEVNAQLPTLLEHVAWSEKEKLQNEKLGLGFYFSGHPFSFYLKELNQFITTRLDKLRSQREPQLIAGIIHAIRTQMTKRGKMAIVTLDDGRARVDIVIYNEILGEHSSWLKEDQLLVAKVIIGNSMNDPNELRITAEKLYDLTNARSQSAKKIQFTINQSIIDCKLVVPKLKELIAANLPVAKGNHGQVQPTRCPVTILYQNQQATCVIELGDAWHVLLSDFFIESVSQLFKPENVQILY
ncbi:MAG TPA: DNA polymerase III subunit alpha [Nitrosomonas sp.]|nr:DNA polymerase III subunit alpha [Nitrosomonas sp.]